MGKDKKKKKKDDSKKKKKSKDSGIEFRSFGFAKGRIFVFEMEAPTYPQRLSPSQMSRGSIKKRV